MKTTLILLTIAAGTMFAQPPAANSTTPTAPAIKHATVEQRKDKQQKRIAQGVANGSLTAKETAKLETKEAKLNQTIAAQRAANGGKLTPKEKKIVARKQNAMSKEITKEKHDAQTQK